MRVAYSNVRGLRRTQAKDKLRSLVQQFSPSLLWVAEPKVKMSNSILKQLKLPGMCQMIIHNSSDSVKVISSTRQAITFQVGDVLVTSIHTACLTIDKRILWEELLNINKRNLPWMVLGDFNVVLSCEEQKGRRPPLRIAVQDFRDCSKSCNLIQAHRIGIKFSWCDNRVGKTRILCDLDKAFYNLKWLEKFDTWSYKVGVRGTSDHGAILGGVTQNAKPKNIPFRYQSVWTTQPNFLSVIQESWTEDCEGNPAFCFIEEVVLAASLESDVDPENIVLLDKLVTTRGMHELAAQIRKAQNDINELENAYGNLVTTQYQIDDTLVTYYKNKFEEKQVDFVEELFEAIPKILTDEDNFFLDVIPSQMEIKDAVFGMDANSVPGPDRFPSSFYRFAWTVVGTELVEDIQYCCRNIFIPKGFNSNFLFLLPKVQGAKRAENFRPIGLANINFKIITRIITTRISTVIGEMVSIQQGAFIKGMNIHEKIA
ncbi:uncharacterized protein LOC113352378 [Papaver somniferum]|uniref:uncharacterized protein LOC113352378 n=1 Tax=Papaver somniferum TaxID=3469 RepID=UPI000E6FAF2B|nr:uncharacterized protein LOC113352378 [Papaver somniferum]